MNECVIVLGPYRSGTSLAAQVLEALGVDFGDPRERLSPNRFNPGGYLERGDLNALNRRLITSAGRSLGDPGDPETLCQNADRAILDSVAFPWPSHGSIWGLKDPRFCATLKIWIEHGILRADTIQILYVIRDPEAIVRSSLKHPSVQKFCEGDEERARRMVIAYLESAAWQVRVLGLPTFRLNYEDLIRDPHEHVGQIAHWLGIDHPGLIRRAAHKVGKSSALRRYVVGRTASLPFRAVRKAYRMLTSHGRSSAPAS